MTDPAARRGGATLEFRHVSKRFGGGSGPGAVNDLSFSVPAGKICVLVGPSGCGKTTSLKMVNRLIEPMAGEILLDGRNVLAEDPITLRRRIGYVIQHVGLLPHLTVAQNVATVPRLLGWEGSRQRERTAELLALVGLEPARYGERYPAELSGGERQRVALARVLARRPAVLLLDEPLSALDARTRAGAARELARVLREVDAPALLVTHDFAEAAQLGDRVGVIDAGRVIQEGTATELAAEPRSAFVADFTGAVVLTGTARMGTDGLTRVELDGGREVVTTERAEGPVAVSVYPWEIAIEQGDVPRAPGSTQNHLPVEVLSVTTVGNRVRLGLAGPQPLVAEITGSSAERLDLRQGARVTASWKAAATRVVAI